MIGNVVNTFRESVRYRGRSGHYSWLAHRLTGLGILSFLLIHTWDTANAFYAPNVYAWSVDIFKHPFFGLGEIAVLGCVIYHSFNGLRITLLDFKPEWWKHQAKSALWVLLIFAVLFVPAALYLTKGIVDSCGKAPHWDISAAQAERIGMEDKGCMSLPPLSAYDKY